MNAEMETFYIDPNFDDIHIYLHLTHLKHLFGFSKKSLPMFLKNHAEWNNIPSHEELMRAFQTLQPKTTYIVKTLARLGFSPYTISDMLEITKQTVSYHMSREKDFYYECPEYRRLVYGPNYDKTFRIVYKHK